MDASGRDVRFADGSTVSPARGDLGDRLPCSTTPSCRLPVFGADGRVEHRRGVTAVPGLYFLGLPWQYTRGSALLGWVKDDAQYIASEIARAATATSEPPAVRTAA